MKYKTYLEIIFISLDEAKYNKESEQFEFDTHTERASKKWLKAPPHPCNCFAPNQKVLYI